MLFFILSSIIISIYIYYIFDSLLSFRLMFYIYIEVLSRLFFVKFIEIVQYIITHLQFQYFIILLFNIFPSDYQLGGLQDYN